MQQYKKSRILSFTLLCIGTICLYASLTYLDRARTALFERSKEFIAADLRVSSRSGELQLQSLVDQAQKYNLTSCQSYELPTNIKRNNEFQLVVIKSIQDCYPLYGKVEVAGAQQTPSHLLANQQYVSDRHNDKVETNTIEINGSLFTLAGYVTSRTDSFAQDLNLIETIMIRHSDIHTLQLVGPLSRIKKILYLQGEPSDIKAFKQDISKTWKKNTLTIEDASDASTLDAQRVFSIHRIVAVVTILIALLFTLFFIISSRPLIQREINQHSLLFDHGISENTLLRRLLTINSIQIIGILILPALLKFAPIPFITSFCFVLTIATGMRIVLFENKIRIKVVTFSLILITAVLLVEYMRIGFNVEQFSYVIGIIGVSALALYYYHRGICHLLLLIPRLPNGLFYALSTMKAIRMSSITVVAIVLATVTVGLTFMLRELIVKEWETLKNINTPNYFVIGIESEQRESFQQVVQGNVQNVSELSPLYRARLTHINNTDVNTISFTSSEAKRFATRDYNLTNHSGEQEIIIEKAYAERLDLSVADTLTFSLYGETIVARIDEIKIIQWSSFKPNFFVSVNKKILKDFPHNYITSLHADEREGRFLYQLSETYPNVTVFDLNSIVKSALLLINDAIVLVLWATLLISILTILALLAITISNQQLRSSINASLFHHGITYPTIQKYTTLEQFIFAITSLLPSIPITLICFYLLRDFLQIDTDLLLSEQLVIFTLCYGSAMAVLLLTTRVRVSST